MAAEINCNKITSVSLYVFSFYLVIVQASLVDIIIVTFNFVWFSCVSVFKIAIIWLVLSFSNQTHIKTSADVGNYVDF